MKTLRSGLFVLTVAIGLLVGQSSVFGQQVDLMNIDSWGNTDTNATSCGLFWTNGPNGVQLLQDDVSITLLGGTNATNLSELVTLTTSDGSAYGDVSFIGDGILIDPSGSDYTVPGAANNSVVVLELQVWIGPDTNFAAAVADGSAVADSGWFYNPSGGGGSPPSIPADLMGMPAMILSTPQQQQQQQQQSQAGIGQLSDSSSSPATAPAPLIINVWLALYPASDKSPTMRINGTNFQSGATLTFGDPLGNRFTVSNLSFFSTNVLSYLFTNWDDPGIWTVQVNNTNGQSSGQVSFTVTNSLWIGIDAFSNQVASVTLHNPMIGYYQLMGITNVNDTNWTTVATVTNLPGSAPTNFALLPVTNSPLMIFRPMPSSTNFVTITNAYTTGGSVVDAIRPSTPGGSYQSGQFIVSMASGSVPASGLIVYFQVSGLAVTNVDYTIHFEDDDTETYGPVTLTTNGIGQVTVMSTNDLVHIYIDPIYSSNLNLSDSVTVTLMPGDGYLANPAYASATLDIYDPLTNVFTSFVQVTGPTGIDYDPVNNSLLVSVNHFQDNLQPNFVNIASNGTVSQWSGLNSLTNFELNLAVAKATANGFTEGDIYYGTMYTGTNIFYYGTNNSWLGWISADASRSNNNWLALTNLVNHPWTFGVCFDQTGTFSNNLIAVGEDGSVWTVTAATNATRLATIAAGALEGVVTIPNVPATWGPWADKIITGSQIDHKIYAIGSNGGIRSYPLNIWAEDFHIIPANQNLYCLDPSNGGSILTVSSNYFANFVGSLLITQSGDFQSYPAKLIVVYWDGTNFISRKIPYANAFEAVTFAPPPF